MKRFVAADLAVVGCSTAAHAMRCSQWEHLDDEAKLDDILDEYYLICVQ